MLFLPLLILSCRGGDVMAQGKTEEAALYNRLSLEKSPYLLQHATNPVDWYPWNEEAFARARREDKPVFLSIGYSTCHWCHVMESESFEDEEVAGLMNDTFVSIKVDREERPDIDGIYMTVAQLLTGRVGWPLTIIMTPDKKPFFAATYIPKRSRQGLVGMLDLIPRIKTLWQNRRKDLESSADSVLSALESMEERGSDGEELTEEVLSKAFEQLGKAYEPEYGGFGTAPKFPTPPILAFLLRYWKRTGSGEALEMVEHTLKNMRRGGIFDHVGFGFHRYSTDQRWLVPHFEKMLYDQAQLASVFLETYQATGDKQYARAAEEVFAYVLRDMSSPLGGFFSAEDADSEGTEGKFYLWKAEEIRDVLGEDASAIINMMGVEESPGAADGNILHLERSWEELSREEGVEAGALRKLWESVRRKLFRYREKRPRPLLDDKILADWNGLMIAALARGALLDDAYPAAAKKAADFVLSHMRAADGRLWHRYREGKASIKANLDDYAFMIMGLIELYQASFEAPYLAAAKELADLMIEYFWDNEEGGFFFTPSDGEELLIRRKESLDNALPSGNSAAMTELLRLARLTGEMSYEEIAIRIGRRFAASAAEYPSLHPYMMTAVDFLAGPAFEIVIVGSKDDEKLPELQKRLLSAFVPNKVVLFKPHQEESTGESTDIERIAPYTRYQVALDGQLTVYVCSNFVCELPTTDIAEAMARLGVSPSHR
jgi:uncharacterized protein YyaL (SSP411 family)